MELKKLKQKIEEEKTLSVNDEITLMSEVAENNAKERLQARYSTGIRILDDALRLDKVDKGGVTGGDIVVIAGLPGNGKSLLSATLSYNLMKKEGLPSLWFSYEVNVYHLWKIFEKMEATEDDILTVPFTNTTGKLEWIEKKIKEAKEKFLIKVVVIDHLGYLAPFQKMNQNMSQNYSVYLAQIVRDLKTIAVKNDIIIILPVHVKKNTTEEISIRDVGHSGGIVQEADVVLLISREEDKTSNAKTLYTPLSNIVVGKNRIGDETPRWKAEKVYGRLVETDKVLDIEYDYK